ncbi:MAG: serine--tRNA ligase [Bacteroidota bacterium]|jgi:seryl-tRNA synthetase|nr:serine--tRNA ligase [Bacteroidales bacterium]MDI9535157.1 serine--tRNA ligase [Bacteroidota bacterium]OQC45770.1 MAG: Serine--tRNA ligase [Bacteroidetes bacterium ADurb.Bin028]NLP20897.1 serine--tRNA ligase [Bacteroidales bacterium]HNY44216.1 serine--tRNA ligase [Bacteroidales bacterium]
MLTLRLIREEKDRVIKQLRVKNFEAEELIEKIIELDNKRKDYQFNKDNLQSQLNDISKEIGILYAQKKKDEAEQAKGKTVGIKEELQKFEDLLSSVEKEMDSIIVLLPNIPHESVPAGKTAEDNEIVKEGGKMPDLTVKKPHWDLIKEYDIIDFELGTKITGAGFPVYKGKGAKLQRALINFFLDQAEKAGYTEIQPPLLVNEDSGFGTGQLPDKEGQMYHITLDNFYLIPTAEVPVTNIYRNVILEEKDFPIKNVAYSACFRREAGSWGAHVRGLNRLHQFDKVEIVQIAKPENSYAVLEEMKNHIESLLIKLNLPYRILKLCGGDISFTSALTFDFEVFSAAQERWLEVSSVSNFEDFQANRLKLRYRPENEKKTRLAHSLNGSALALPRIMAALLENNQTEKGIVVPEVLRHFTGFDIITK